MSSDGLLGETGNLLTHNMYAYAGNNPVMNVDPNGDFAISLLGMLITTAIVAWISHDIYQVASGNVYFDIETNEIVNSYKVQSYPVVAGYSVYLKYFSSHKDYFTGSSGGIAAEWIGHNIAFDAFSVTSLFGWWTDEKESARQVHLGPSIYSEKRVLYRNVFLIIQAAIDPIGYVYDAHQNGRRIFPIIEPIIPRLSRG